MEVSLNYKYEARERHPGIWIHDAPKGIPIDIKDEVDGRKITIGNVEIHVFEEIPA